MPFVSVYMTVECRPEISYLVKTQFVHIYTVYCERISDRESERLNRHGKIEDTGGG